MAAHSPRTATEADLARIAQFNRTDTTFPDNVTLQELIEAQIEKHASETAVICDHDKVFGVPSLTYAQLNDKVNQLAHLLRAEGVRPGHIVALMVERSFAMIIGILGIVKAGGGLSARLAGQSAGSHRLHAEGWRGQDTAGAEEDSRPASCLEG